MNQRSYLAIHSPIIGKVSETQSGRWYALYLRSRHEKVVDLRLREKQIKTLLPMIEEVRQYSDRKKKVIEPLFKGYLFVHTDLRNQVTILQTEGVVRFVGIGSKPSPIPDNQIESVRIIGGEPSRITREHYLKSGESVRVKSGPFEGIEGFVVAMRGSTRVVISVDCIGQSISVDVAPDLVVKLSEKSALGSGE
jgi:transcription elongation factor/antiterminator RfaH